MDKHYQIKKYVPFFNILSFILLDIFDTLFRQATTFKRIISRFLCIIYQKCWVSTRLEKQFLKKTNVAFCLRIDSLWSRYFRQWTINISFTAFVIFSVSISFQFKCHFFPHSLFLQLFLLLSQGLYYFYLNSPHSFHHFIYPVTFNLFDSPYLHQIYLHTFCISFQTNSFISFCLLSFTLLFSLISTSSLFRSFIVTLTVHSFLSIFTSSLPLHSLLAYSYFLSNILFSHIPFFSLIPFSQLLIPLLPFPLHCFSFPPPHASLFSSFHLFHSIHASHTQTSFHSESRFIF